MTDTTANTAQITAELSRLFETHAHVAAADALADAPFLHRLLAGAKNISNVRNSFRGLWRLHRFMDAAQIHFGVCFALEDNEKDWTLQNFAAHIVQKKSNRAAQKTLAAKRVKRAKQYMLDGMVKSFLFLSLPLGIFAVYAFDSMAARVAALGVAAIPSLLVLWFCIKEWIFYRQLSAKIDTAEDMKNDG